MDTIKSNLSTGPKCGSKAIPRIIKIDKQVQNENGIIQFVPPNPLPPVTEQALLYIKSLCKNLARAFGWRKLYASTKLGGTNGKDAENV